MDLRPRKRISFSGFTNAEIEKMEKLLDDDPEKSVDQQYCKKLARVFNRSKGRAGKPIVKWTEIENWFQNRQQLNLSQVTSADNIGKLPDSGETCQSNKVNENSHVPKGEKVPSNMEFEARSSSDGAWYDIEKFLSHRFLDSGEAEVLVRFIGFGPEEDEWINVKTAVRERSISLENSECNLVQVGDYVLCFQEQKDQARYHEAHVVGIEKRMHDIRGCRCLFTIKYDHENIQEKVHLNRLCFRPCILGVLVKKERESP
ncbi:hypothetical protein M9H77_19032 [Catharanthus roseus]|uniref:Uncharacterized protein n=1 Tax=Catharanthus roseus TaxID=4058 RepID=A0ACC0B957_CATRO|nr:hypothetical protein M9H77_19032 [Catharanthus roseus]